MLYTYSTTEQTVAVNGTVVLNTNGITGCSCISHTAGTGVINVNRAGYYKVTINASAANTTTTSGNIVLQLYGNEVAQAGAFATATSDSTADVQNLSFTTIVRTLPNCCAVNANLPMSLTLVNTGIAAIFTNVSMVVEKL